MGTGTATSTSTATATATVTATATATTTATTRATATATTTCWNNREEVKRQGIAFGNYRIQPLLQALRRNVGSITAAKCGQWFRYMQTYLPRCLNGEHIEG